VRVDLITHRVDFAQDFVSHHHGRLTRKLVRGNVKVGPADTGRHDANTGDSLGRNWFVDQVQAHRIGPDAEFDQGQHLALDE
jgi:hypothetical protein